MDDFEDRYTEAVEAGRRNLRATELLGNWCFHAEFVRSPGRGLIEAETGLPIGHMGVQCKFSKSSSMFCWLLEDAAYDFYQNNCKACEERVPVSFPNIMSFVAPREAAAEQRKTERAKEERERNRKREQRQQERASLRGELSMEESFVLDLLDELDQEDIARDDPRLEELASLAPETFTRSVIDHLLPAVLDEYLPYSKSAAKALLRVPLEQEEEIAVAIRLISGYERSRTAIEVVLSNAKSLSKGDLRKVLPRFVSMALGPPPGMNIGSSKPIRLDDTPIRALFEQKRDEICSEVVTLIRDANPDGVRAAVEIILATDCDDLLAEHIRSIFAKLMRRRTLLPGERRDSNVIYYLREAASRSLERFPDETDEIIQSFLADNDDVGRKEANKAYRSVLKHNYRGKPRIEKAQRIAFKRLLWAAIESPEDAIDEAAQFFRHSWDEYAQLASEFFDDLIGAAATLSKKYEQVDAESPIEVTDGALSELDRQNRRVAINGLQEALIEWAAVGAKTNGRKGIEGYLDLYRRLPEDQDQMRGNMIVHVSKLLTGVESLKLVLSDWYRALVDERTVVRASAARAWENVPHELVKNFPDLFFEAFAVLLSDPYVIVHRSAVHSLKRRSFPKEKCNLIKHGLWNLVLYYSRESKQDNFVIDCVDAIAFLCLSRNERNGNLGKLLSDILLGLEGSALYHAVDRLHYGFAEVPGFARVALKSIQDGYTRSISIDDCVSSILNAPDDELQDCVGDIKKALESLRPFRHENFLEALVYAAALTKAKEHSTASTCLRELLMSIPKEDRHEQLRLETAVVASVSEIELAIGNTGTFGKLIGEWRSLLSELEKENEERAKLRDFPQRFFFPD